MLKIMENANLSWFKFLNYVLMELLQKSKDTQIFVKSQKNVSAVLVRKLKRIVL